MMEKTSSPLTACERASRSWRVTARPASETVLKASRSRDRTRTSCPWGWAARKASAAWRTTWARATDSVMTRRTCASARIHSICSAESVS